jgi:glucose-6-phosphate isomerase
MIVNSPRQSLPAWKHLSSLATKELGRSIAALFASDFSRESRLQVKAAGMTLDVSHQAIDDSVIAGLAQLLNECDFSSARHALLSGQPINHTEKRPALHTLLRAEKGDALVPADLLDEALTERERMLSFANAVRSGQYTQRDGKPFSDVLVLGIGGSHLAPEFVCRAIVPQLADTSGPRVQFVSNVDGANLAYALRGLDAANTLVIVPSKSFSTDETLTNLETVRAWLVAGVGEEQAKAQIASASAKPQTVQSLGIAAELNFKLWDWVGGRYSLWSSVGLPVAIAIGVDNFRALLAGAREMDQHFVAAPLDRNIPVLLGAIGVWNRNFLNIPTHAVLPYAECLSWLPKHLQQLEMESLGKHVSRDGKPLPYPTCPVIWGDAGTNGQHAFHQWLHQGTDLISLDFIGVQSPIETHDVIGDRAIAHHKRMLANCYAQRKALAFGTEALGKSATDEFAAHKACKGGRPSSLLLLDAVNARSVGALVAAYEHKVFVQSVMWDLNAFDQWGVELGKVLAKELLPTL